MDKKFDLLQALRVFNKVTQWGDKEDEDHVLHGLRANAGFDGYTVTLKDDYVSLTVYFHNKFNLDYSDRKALELFLTKMHDIDETYD